MLLITPIPIENIGIHLLLKKGTLPIRPHGKKAKFPAKGRRLQLLMTEATIAGITQSSFQQVLLPLIR
jgi:hypothetical protein